ncbi:MAG TPA: sigma-70 family RNA polymerase sigma factor [Candidatus Binatia bacterium]
MSVCLSMRDEASSNAVALDAPAAAIMRDRAPRMLKISDQDEIDMIRRLQAGDERALEAIFNRYSTRLYNLAHRILGDVADAEEVIQDVFWTAFRKAESFRGNSQLSTWLYRLTVNAALGRLRRRKAQKQIQYEEYLPRFENDGHHKVRPVIDWSETLDQRYARREIHLLLQAAVNELRALDKAVVVMSDMDGMCDREIAAALGLTVSAVKTRLHRARLFVRGKLAVHLGHSPD